MVNISDLFDFSKSQQNEEPSVSLGLLKSYGLNPKQEEAVFYGTGPLLVLAGAGTGKTKVLTCRIAQVIASGQAWPSQILAVTFTNKAAAEMKHRLQDLLSGEYDISSLWMGTFHSLCVRILRQYPILAGRKDGFVILDEDDQIRLIKQVITSLNIADKDLAPKIALYFINRWKDRALLPGQVTGVEQGQASEDVLKIYTLYQQRLAELNALDFGDLLLLTINLFKNQPEILRIYQQKFRFILVDEYQDTNVAQYLWLRQLSAQHQNLTCVGDDDQSIYGWRGAEVDNILRFERDFKGAHIVRLEQNYRSTPAILKAAGSVIGHNASRLGKELWTDKKDQQRISVHHFSYSGDEARFIADHITSFRQKGMVYKDMAILVRSSFLMREMEEALLAQAIPYRVIGGLRFYERAEIKDAVAYLRLIANPLDDLAFERVINNPKRGVGPAAMIQIKAFAQQHQQGLIQAVIAMVQAKLFKPALQQSLGTFSQYYQTWCQHALDFSLDALCDQILDQSGYMAMWRSDPSFEAKGKIENLKELITALAEFASLSEFLEHVSLVMDNQQNVNQDEVAIMTIHGAKGLEFPLVFLPACEDGIFPNMRAIEESGTRGLEEERRLAYVAMTRAMRHLCFSYSDMRKMHGQLIQSLPSRFLGEIDEAVIDQINHVMPRSDSRLHAEHRDWQDRDDARYVRQRSGDVSRGPKASAYPMRPLSQNSGVSSIKAGDILAKKSVFQVGDQVFHDKFGYGLVLECEGVRAEVDFEHSGVKKLATAFLKKA